MSSYQTILQLSALAGFWGAFLSHSSFPSSSSLQWRLPTAIQLIPGILLLLGACSIPETPSFLAGKGREREAERSLVSLRGVRGEEWMVEGEMQEIRDAARVSSLVRDKNVPFSKELLKPGIRKRLVVGVGLMIAQNMVGLNECVRCTSNLHVRRFHLRLLVPLLNRRIRRRQTPLSNCIHVRLRQNKG